jgi:hypothetical protein
MIDKTNWNTGNLLWVAGVLLGEGFFTPHIARTGRDAGQIKLRVGCQMSDEDIILCLHKIAGFGSVRGPLYSKDKRKDGSDRLPTWSWRSTSSLSVYEFDMALAPYLGEHKRRDVQAAFDLRREYEITASTRGNLIRVFSEERSSILPPARQFFI